jgi:dynein heavy chain, axonemal
MLLVEFKRLRLMGPLDQHQLKNNVTIELEKSHSFIKNIWYTKFINIFENEKDKHDSFYNSVDVLASNQLKDLILRTIYAWCHLFSPENYSNVPIIKMELTFDDEKMQFYPHYNSIKEILCAITDKIATSLPGIQTLKAFQNGSTGETIDTQIAEHFLKDSAQRLDACLKHYMIEPQQILNEYIEKYSFLVDGTAEQQITEFIQNKTKTFDDYTDQINKYQSIISDIKLELNIIEFNMIYLICDDLKTALIKITRDHMYRLLNVLITKHRSECNKVCAEFNKIKERALKRPDTTEELNEMVKFIDNAKSVGIVQLGTQIRDIKKSMAFLLDTHLFPPEDIELNTQVLLWPTDIGPIFDINEEVVFFL